MGCWRLLFLIFHLKKKVLKSKIGQGIYFCPPFFNLADVNFDDYLDKINIKVNTNKKLSGEEEIVLMLRCLVPSFREKASFLKEISKLLDKKELFDEFRFQYFEAIVLLEIHNVIPEDDGREIMEKIGEIKMTPQAQTLVNKVVTEVNDKILYETREEGIQEGMKRGIERGMEKGKEEAAVEIAKNLKDDLSDEVIAIRTNLPLDVVRKL